MKYAVKCDDCKKEIRRTDNITESYQGGRCDECKGGGKKMTPPGRPIGSKSRKPRKDVRLTISFTPAEIAVIEAARGKIIKGVFIRRAALRAAEESTSWVIELEPGVWAAPWAGDPGRTLKLDFAREFSTQGIAEMALKNARVYRPFANAKIYRASLRAAEEWKK